MKYYSFFFIFFRVCTEAWWLPAAIPASKVLAKD